MDHYLRDFSDISLDEASVLIEITGKKSCSGQPSYYRTAWIFAGESNHLRFPSYWPSDCCSIYQHVYQILRGDDVKKISIVSCCERLWATVILYRLLGGGVRRSPDVQGFITTIGELSEFQKAFLRQLDASRDVDDQADTLTKILRLVESHGRKESADSFLSTFPPGVIIPLLLRLTPPQVRRIRGDGAFEKHSNNSPTKLTTGQQVPCRERATAKLKSHDADGMTGSIMNDELSKLLFPNDVRLLDVRSMLRSSKQTKISLKVSREKTS